LQAIALCQHGVQSITVLEVATRALNSISNTAVGEPTVIAWSLDQPILAAGDSSGNLLLYNMRVRRTIPVVGKHTGAILSAAWSMDGSIALGGDDCMVTVSSSEGDTKDSAELNTVPVQIAFARQKTDTPSAARKATTLTVNMGRASVLLMDMANAAEKPFELTFQDRYGPIEQFAWFGDGYLALGFRGGFVTVISTHKRELGSEIFTTPLQRDPVKHMAVSDKLMQLAVAGSSTVRLLDLQAALVSKSAPPVRPRAVAGRGTARF
jgi:WD repeat-containing protein 19